MTRVSSSQFFDTSAYRLNENNRKMFDLQRQLSTGRKFDRTSEDPEAAQRASRIEASIRRNEQTIRNIETNQRFLDEAESFVTTAVDQLQRIRLLAVQASNDTYVTADMRLVAAEIDQQLEALLRTANSRSLGRSVFAGAETDSTAFTATRDSSGKITGISYSGDAVELNVEAEGHVPVTWPGNVAFAAGETVYSSTADYWDGGDASSHADRELSARFLPSSGVVDGALRINGQLVRYDLDGDPTSGEGDSLLDIARNINSAEVGVTARVTGIMESPNTVALPATNFAAQFPGFTAGTVSINGSSISVTANDTIFTFAQKINAAGAGVTAGVFDANGEEIDGNPSPATATGPLTLRLSGGMEISDDAAGDSSIMRDLGITTTPAAATGSNLAGDVIENYRLQISGNRPGGFTVEDAEGSLAEDLGLTSDEALEDGGLVFEALIEMRDALESGDNSFIRSDSLVAIDEALESLEVTRTEAGVRTNRFEAQRGRLEQINLNASEILGKVRDANIAEVISEMNLQLAAQNAALKATSTILNLSLLNIL